MRTAACLTSIAIGAVFTFAVTAHPSFLNLQIAGVVIMATGGARLLLPRRGQQGWLRRRTILRRGLRGPVAGRVDETRLTPYVMVNPAGFARESNGAQPGDQTNPVLPADDLKAGQDTAAGDSPTTASEVAEEYIEH